MYAYELVYPGADRYLSCLIQYQEHQEAVDCKCYRFERRLFLVFPPSALAAKQADLTAFRNIHPGYLHDAHFVPARWLGDALVLCERYPAAHKQLQLAIVDLSVEEFLLNLARVFCCEWQAIKKFSGHSGAVE